MYRNIRKRTHTRTTDFTNVYVQTQEGQDLDVGEAEVGDSEDPDLIDGYEEETSEEPFDAEPPMEPPMEAPMEAPMEQVMEPEQIFPLKTNFELLIRSSHSSHSSHSTVQQQYQKMMKVFCFQTHPKPVQKKLGTIKWSLKTI